MNDQVGNAAVRLVGGLMEVLLPLYFMVGLAFGELQAWRDMGWASLISPATHLYAIWYGFTWPYYVFRGEGDPVIRGKVVGFGVISDAKETYITNGCKRFSSKDLGWNSERLRDVTTVGNHLIREGSTGSKRMFVLEFTSQDDCEFEIGRLAGAYEAGTTTFEGLYSVAISTSP